MKCQKCKSEKIVSMCAKCPDGFDVDFYGKNYESVVIKNISDGEYVDPKICLDCGQCQGKFPVDFPIVIDIEEKNRQEEETINWHKSVKLLIEACKEHECKEKEFVPCDSMRFLGFGFICKGCGSFHCVKISNVKIKNGEDIELYKLFTERNGRETLCEMINEKI